MGFVDHVVRRGLEHPSTINLLKRVVHEGPKLEVPKWGVAVLTVTFIAFIFIMGSIEYTLKEVVATLTMIETPSAAITVSASNEDLALKDSKEPLLETGPTITLVNQKPITSSIRGTIRHLVQQAGKWSRWRGIRSNFLYGLAFSVAANVFDFILPHFPGRMIIISAASGAVCANLHASWTHKVISMPSKLNFFKRVAPRSQWKLLAFPAAVQASTRYISLYIAQGFIILFGLDQIKNDNFANYSGYQWTSLAARTVSVFVIMLACGFFIVLPAIVTLIRVEASILPDDQDTIVPFDRTFDGKVVPKILGGTGAIGFLNAWKSFNWEARRRLIKTYLKAFAISTTLFIVMAHVLVLETYLIMGPAIGKYLAQVKQEGFEQ